MAWYHLSYKKDLSAIVKTDSPENAAFLQPSVPKWINKLKPEDIYKEPDSPPRISVAPTVWQCVAGFGRAEGNPTGTVYIYEVQTSIVTQRTFNSTETEITDEQWITDNIINDKIQINKLGFIEIDQIFLEIKNCTIAKTLNVMKSINEWETIWHGDGGNNGEKEWKLNASEINKIKQ